MTTVWTGNLVDPWITPEGELLIVAPALPGIEASPGLRVVLPDDCACDGLRLAPGYPPVHPSWVAVAGRLPQRRHWPLWAVEPERITDFGYLRFLEAFRVRKVFPALPGEIVSPWPGPDFAEFSDWLRVLGIPQRLAVVRYPDALAPTGSLSVVPFGLECRGVIDGVARLPPRSRMINGMSTKLLFEVPAGTLVRATGECQYGEGHWQEFAVQGGPLDGTTFDLPEPERWLLLDPSLPADPGREERLAAVVPDWNVRSVVA